MVSQNSNARFIQANATPPEAITPQQTADLLQISRRTLLRWTDQKYCPAPRKIGAVVRYSRREMIDWLDSGCPDCKV